MSKGWWWCVKASVWLVGVVTNTCLIRAKCSTTINTQLVIPGQLQTNEATQKEVDNDKNGSLKWLVRCVGQCGG